MGVLNAIAPDSCEDTVNSYDLRDSIYDRKTRLIDCV